MKKIIIAIDGYSSSGKSTRARALAAAISYRYIETGDKYRAVSIYAIEHGIVDNNGVLDNVALHNSLDKISIDFALQNDGTQHTILDGQDVESKIRTMEVSNHVSTVAADPQVRQMLGRMQQQFGIEKGIVMDGRDIGTTIFPDAELKIYVNAPAETRARRRYDELKAKGDTASTFEEVLANVEHRDHIDRTREVSPLKRADDAIDLDNSNMSIDEQNRWLLEKYHAVINN